MTLSFFAAAINSAVIFVPLRITQPSYSPQIFLSSSGFRPILTSTSKPSVFLKTANPSGARESVTRIFIWVPRIRYGSRIEDRGWRNPRSSIVDPRVLCQRLHQHFLSRSDATTEGNFGTKFSQRHFQCSDRRDHIESSHVTDMRDAN